MVFNKTFYLSVFVIIGFTIQHSLNKFASQKQASAASTWINVCAAMALLTTLRSLLDLQIIGKKTLFFLTR